MYDQFLPNFHKNDGIVAGNKNVISADLENVDQWLNLQKSLGVVHYTTDLIQTSNK